MKKTTHLILIMLLMVIYSKCLAENKEKSINNNRSEDIMIKDIEDWYMKTMVRGFNKNPFYSIFQTKKDRKEYHVYVRLNVHTNSSSIPPESYNITDSLCPQRSHYINETMKDYPINFYIHQFNTKGKEMYIFDCTQDYPQTRKQHAKTVD